MWFIEGSINDTTFSKLIYIRTKREAGNIVNLPFVIGRRAGDLIYSSDRRVSRIHAHIELDLTQNAPKLFITDLSKFGTKVNNRTITKNTRYELIANDIVCVGISSSNFTVKWIDFFALFSRIQSQERAAMKTLILKMAGRVSAHNEWNDSVTHLFIANKDLPITAKVISAIINDKHIVTMEWLKYLFKNGCIPCHEWCLKSMPSNLKKWLQIGTENEAKYNIKRCHLFKERLFVFMDESLLQNNKKIIHDCSGNVLLIENMNNLTQEYVQKQFKADIFITHFAIFDDEQHANNDGTVNGLHCFSSCSIANSILSCNTNGSENEIKWISFERKAAAAIKVIKRENKKRKREEMECESDILANTEIISPPPKKKKVALLKKETSVLSPRKLKCTQFQSIRRIKSQSESQLNESMICKYTSTIYRNLSALSLNTKRNKKQHKKLGFKGVKKNEYLELDDADDEDVHLEKQKELYSKENICKLQEEFIEMDLIQKSEEKQEQEEEKQMVELNQVNFKAFKGNPHYMKAMQSRIKHMVEFDLNFRNNDNYQKNAKFDEKKFKKQQAKEEKQEKEVENLFGSRKRAKKANKKRKRNQNDEDENLSSLNRNRAKRRRKN